MSDNITVAIKVRPLIKREIDSNECIIWKIKDNTISPKGSNEQLYTFDHIFDHNASTEDVYNMVVDPVVTAAVNGIHGTIFAYGQTSSGKTYTMMGDKDEMGIIPLAVNHIFHQIEHSDREFLLRVSYIEIYNEKINDLLNRKETDLKIHEDVKGGIIIKCKEECIRSSSQVLNLMNEGTKIRRMGETNMNERSSRSHTIFRIIIESRESNLTSEEETVPYKVSHLNLVDLAGSERANQTGATGARLKEGAHINKSLLALSLVIQQLSDGPPDPNKFINFRDSKLTRILQSSLGGNAMTSIICAVTPAALEETHSTLHFASKAKAIKNKPIVNEVLSDETMMKRMAKQVDKLKNELAKAITEKTVNEETNILLNNRIKLLEQSIIAGIGPVIENKKDRRRTWCGSSMQRHIRTLSPKLNRIDEIPKPSLISSAVDIRKINFTRGKSDREDFSSKCTTPFEEFELALYESRLSSISECTDNSFSEDQLSESIDVKISDTYSNSPFQEQWYKVGHTPPNKLRDRANKWSEELEALKTFTQLEEDISVKRDTELQKAKDEISTLEFKLMHSEDKYLKLQEKLHEIDDIQQLLTNSKNENEELTNEIKYQLEVETSLKKKLLVAENENKDLLYLADANKNNSKARETELIRMIEEYKSKSSDIKITELSEKLFELELSNEKLQQEKNSLQCSNEEIRHTFQQKLDDASKIIRENEVAYSAAMRENLCLLDQLQANKNLKISMENDIKEFRVCIEKLEVELQYLSTEKRDLLNKLSQTESQTFDFNNGICNQPSMSSSISSGFIESELISDKVANSQLQISKSDNNLLLEQQVKLNEELNEKQELILKSNNEIACLQRELHELRQYLSENEHFIQTLQLEKSPLKIPFDTISCDSLKLESDDNVKLESDINKEYGILKNGIDIIRSENECLKSKIERTVEQLNKANVVENKLREELMVEKEKNKSLLAEREVLYEETSDITEKTSECDMNHQDNVSSISELNNQILILKNKLIEKDDLITNMKDKILSLEKDIITVKGKLSSLMYEISMKENLIDQLTIEKVELETDNDNLVTKNSELNCDASQLKLKTADLETSAANLRSEITRKQLQIDECNSKYDNVFDELNAMKQLIEKKNESLELSNYEKMKLQSNLSVAQAELEKLNEIQNSFVTQEDFNIIKNDKVKLENDYSNLIIELDKLQNEKAKCDLEEKVNELNIKNNELNSYTEELVLNINCFKSQIATLENEKKILEDNWKQADYYICGLRKDNDNVCEEINNISETLNDTLKEMAKLRKHIEHLENDEKDALIVNQDINASISKLQNQIVILEKKLVEKDDVIKNMKEEMLTLEKDILTEKAKLASLMEEILIKENLIDQLTIEKVELETDNDNLVSKYSKLNYDTSQLKLQSADLETTVENLRMELTRERLDVKGNSKYGDVLSELNTIKSIDELKSKNLHLTSITNNISSELMKIYNTLCLCISLSGKQHEKDKLLNSNNESENLDCIYLIQIIKDTIELHIQTAQDLKLQKSQLIEQITEINAEKADLQIRCNQSNSVTEEFICLKNYMLQEINSVHPKNTINTENYSLKELLKVCTTLIINKQVDIVEELKHKLKKSEDWATKLEGDIELLHKEEEQFKYLDQINKLESSNTDISNQNQLLKQKVEENEAEIISLLMKMKDNIDSNNSLQRLENDLTACKTKLESATNIQQATHMELLREKKENASLRVQYEKVCADVEDVYTKHKICSQNIDELNVKLEKQFQDIELSESKVQEYKRRLELLYAENSKILDDNAQLVREKNNLNEQIVELNQVILVRGEKMQELREEIDIMKCVSSSSHNRRSLGNDLADIIAEKESQINKLTKDYNNKFNSMQEKIILIQKDIVILQQEKQELIREKELKEAEFIELNNKYDCIYAELTNTKNLMINEKDRIKSSGDVPEETERRSCSPFSIAKKAKTKRYSNHDSARNLEISLVNACTMTDADNSQKTIRELEQQLSAEECKLTKLLVEYECDKFTNAKELQRLSQDNKQLTDKLTGLSKVNQELMNSNKEFEKTNNLSSHKEVELLTKKLENVTKERDYLQTKIKTEKVKISPQKLAETISMQAKSKRLSIHDSTRNLSKALTDDAITEAVNAVRDAMLKEIQILQEANKDLAESNKELSTEFEKLKSKYDELDKECNDLVEQIESTDTLNAKLFNEKCDLMARIKEMEAINIPLKSKTAEVSLDLTEVCEKLKQEKMSLELKLIELNKKCVASVSEMESERKKSCKALDDNNSLMARLRILDPNARLTPPKSTVKQNCADCAQNQSKSRRISSHDSARNLEEVTTSEKAIMADLDTQIKDLKKQLDLKECEIARFEFEKPAIVKPFIEKIERLEKDRSELYSKCQQQRLQLRKYTNDALHNNTLISECYKCKGQRNLSFDDVKKEGVLKVSMKTMDTQTDPLISPNVLKPVHQEITKYSSDNHIDSSELYQKFKIQETKKNQYKELSKMRAEEIKKLKIQLDNKNKENNS